MAFTMQGRWRSIVAGAAILASSALGGSAVAAPSKPNIFFAILDNAGVDQLSIFGKGGSIAPKTPRSTSSPEAA